MRFPLGLCPRPYSAPTDSLAVFKGPTSEGREGKRGKGKGRRREGKGREGKSEGRERKGPNILEPLLVIAGLARNGR